MSMGLFANILVIALFCAVGMALIYGIAHFAVLEYQNWKNGRQPVRTERATVYHKHTEKTTVSQGRASSDVFFVTFHTDCGDIVKCYMGYGKYYTLHEGDKGQLTWQGSRLWKFIPEARKETP